jgi:C-8 sterol isomerase
MVHDTSDPNFDMSYIFDPHKLHKLASKRVGLPHKEMVAAIIDDCAREYPGHIETRQKWILSVCGGAMGIMTILHGSLSEYLLIFGTPIVETLWHYGRLVVKELGRGKI